MAIYKDQLVLKPYSFNNATLVFKGEHTAQGVQSFSAEFVNDTSDVDEADDGLAVPVDFATKRGLIKVTIKQWSPTNKYLWDLFAAEDWFAISFADSTVENLKAGGAQCKTQKPPVTSRQKSPEDVEWMFNVVYLECRDGGLALAE